MSPDALHALLMYVFIVVSLISPLPCTSVLVLVALLADRVKSSMLLVVSG